LRGGRKVLKAKVCRQPKRVECVKMWASDGVSEVTCGVVDSCLASHGKCGVVSSVHTTQTDTVSPVRI